MKIQFSSNNLTNDVGGATDIKELVKRPTFKAAYQLGAANWGDFMYTMQFRAKSTIHLSGVIYNDLPLKTGLTLYNLLKISYHNLQ